MLEENARVALMIGESLRDQTIQMGLYEMENLLNRCVFARVFLVIYLHIPAFTLMFSHLYLQVSGSAGGIWERASQGSEQQQKQVLPPLSAGLHQQLYHPQVRLWQRMNQSGLISC